jgi:PAB-dependent poly(A)-specific ribonuclease subunit 3
MSKHPLHSFFIPDDLRHMIQSRQDATYLGNTPVPGIPHEVGPYHSLLPLDHRMGISKIYGYPTPLYRAVSSIDGSVYCLRRVEGKSSILGRAEVMIADK